jgi:hypothetical protein
MSKIILVILIFFSSCSSLVKDDLKNKEFPELLKYLRGQGEGKGRLGLADQKYNFSFEAILKNQKDWILAVSIPFHGEEILQFKNLSKDSEKSIEHQTFERRIENGIKNYLIQHRESSHIAEVFVTELRSLVRLMLHQELGLSLKFPSNSSLELDQIYQVEKKNGFLSIRKSIGLDHEIELKAFNLTDSFFKRTDIFFYSKKSTKKPHSILSLELFWE